MVLFTERDLLRLEASAAEVGSSASTIQEGDLVVIYEGFQSIRFQYCNSKQVFSNRYGNFPMKRWVGQPWGTKVYDQKQNRSWVYLLRPTPELWTQVLQHRTQILYLADIALVCTMLDLRPGAVVLESGTGSGSLTHSLARAVGPTGHVHTFEFHKVRAEQAEKEFAAHGLASFVTVRVRNIEEEGFIPELHGQADAVFLDLPGPHKVVPSAALCLKEDGVLCCFSPCIEQVQRSCEAMVRHGFHDLRTVEVLLREFDCMPEGQISTVEGLIGGRREGRKQQVKRKREEEEAGAGAGKGEEGGSAVVKVTMARPRLDARGHTGYLTFARLGVRVPEGAPRENASEGEEDDE